MSEPGGQLLPITDEQAKALQEAFKLGAKGLDAAKAVGSYLAKILGTTPEDIVGLLGGDWIRARRVENMINLGRATQARLEARNVQPEPAPLAVAIPLLESAADESRDELVDLWARLLAAAMDPQRTKRVRQRFIETVGKLDPIDAVMLRNVSDLRRPDGSSEAVHILAARLLGIGAEEADVSLHHLVDLGCVRDRDMNPAKRIYFDRVVLTSYGIELLRLLEDEI